MLKKSLKIKTKEFLPTIKSGKTAKTAHIRAVFGKNLANKGKIAVSVSKKVDKSAVRRNYLKRITLAEIQKSIQGLRGNIIFMPQQGFSKEFLYEINDLINTIKKTGNWSN